MKRVISGELLYLKIVEIKWVDVPYYNELEPKNVIKKMKLKEKENLETWKSLISYCPELE